MSDDNRVLAVFIDFENLALGFEGKSDRFDIRLVLARLVEKGHIVVKRAYADWKRFSGYSRGLHEHAIELIEIPTRHMTGKNSADMRLCVDAMDLCYAKSHIDSFVILSGDSDFSPLVSKLKENGKRVIGLGVKKSTSDLLRDNCDEFIYYEDLEPEAKEVPPDLAPGLDKKRREVFGLLIDSLRALRRENRETLWASLIKETMRRKSPAFSESYYGFKSFGQLLDAAASHGLIKLNRDAAGRRHSVTGFGEDIDADAPAPRHRSGGEVLAPRHRTTRSSSSRSSSSRSAESQRTSQAPASPAAAPAAPTPPPPQAPPPVAVPPPATATPAAPAAAAAEKAAPPARAPATRRPRRTRTSKTKAAAEEPPA